MSARSFAWTRVRAQMPLAQLLLTRVPLASLLLAPMSGVGAQRPAFSQSVALATFDAAWGRIDSTYYDRAFLATRWTVLRDSLRPRAAAATDNDALRAVLQSLLAQIGVSHFALIPAELAPALDESAPGAAGSGGAGGAGAGARAPSNGTAGVTVRLAGDTLVAWRVDTAGPAWRAGIRPGARIAKVGDYDVQAAIEQVARLGDARVQRQGRFALTRRAMSELDGVRGDSVRVELATVSGAGGGGPPQRVTIVREGIRGEMARFGNLPPLHAHVEYATREVRTAVTARRGERVTQTVRPMRAGIIGFSVWLPVLTPALTAAFDSAGTTDAIIMDVRGNPGGVAGMVSNLAGRVLDSAQSLGALMMRATTLQLRANPAAKPFTGPVAILVDALSASASEFFAAGLQGLGRARVFGDTTAGASVPAGLVRLPNGDVLMHTLADHADPLGRRVEGRGVIPDDVVQFTIRGVAAGRDEVMEAALAWAASAAKR